MMKLAKELLAVCDFDMPLAKTALKNV